MSFYDIDSGLSLCIQGTHPKTNLHRITHRFIPVYTGNSFEPVTYGLEEPVYPCVYRELQFLLTHELDVYGLSLCIQGTPSFSSSRKLCSRFIPVYTGNSGMGDALCWINTVYPCVYRELKYLSLIVHLNSGLSLCIQGTLKLSLVSTGVFAVYPCVYRELARSTGGTITTPRFIPVYTGNSAPKRDRLATSSVYPCVYRELNIICDPKSIQCGLSLCIQGTPLVALVLA